MSKKFDLARAIKSEGRESSFFQRCRLDFVDKFSERGAGVPKGDIVSEWPHPHCTCKNLEAFMYAKVKTQSGSSMYGKVSADTIIEIEVKI